MDSQAFLDFLRKLNVASQENSDTKSISASIQTAYSALPLNPALSKQKCKALHAVNKNTGRPLDSPSDSFFWSALQLWAASDDSEVLVCEGTLSLRQRVQQMALETVEDIESVGRPLAWALNWSPLAGKAGGGQPMAFDGRDIISQLCLQLLLQNPRLHSRNALIDRLRMAERAATASDWFDILASCISGLNSVYIMVDLDVMTRNHMDSLTWPTAFRRIFRDIDTLGTRSLVKCALFTSRPAVSWDPTTPGMTVLRFPMQNPGAPKLPSSSIDRNSWLDCLRKQRLKRVRAESETETEDGISGGDAMAAKRQRAGDSWFDYLSREFEPCIDALRKDDLPRVRIAVLDTGADLSHPDIAAAVDDGRVQYKDFVSGGPDMIDLSGHGTHCASILLKYALNAEVYIGRIVEQDHTDSSGLERLATAVKFAADTWDVDIISVSIGFTNSSPEAGQAVFNALARPILVFASAANNTRHEPKPIRFPASFTQVFCIFSAALDGNPSIFNPEAQSHSSNFMFPGENILGAWPKGLSEKDPDVVVRGPGSYKRLSGTSFATPIAAATAAGVLEFARQPRHISINRVASLRRFEAMEAVFAEMVHNYSRDDARYHYVVPWKLLTRYREKEQVPHLLNYVLERTNT